MKTPLQKESDRGAQNLKLPETAKQTLKLSLPVVCDQLNEMILNWSESQEEGDQEKIWLRIFAALNFEPERCKHYLLRRLGFKGDESSKTIPKPQLPAFETAHLLFGIAKHCTGTFEEMEEIWYHCARFLPQGNKEDYKPTYTSDTKNYLTDFLQTEHKDEYTKFHNKFCRERMVIFFSNLKEDIRKEQESASTPTATSPANAVISTVSTSCSPLQKKEQQHHL